MKAALTVATLFTLATPALAAGRRAEAIVYGFALAPCLIILLATPAALAVRAAWGTPLHLERRATGPGHVPRIVASLVIAAMIFLLSAARGRPAAPWLFLVFSTAFLFGLTIAAVRMGRSLFSNPDRGESAGAFVLGWLLLAGLSLLPVLGFLLLLWFGSFGLGALLIAPFRGTAGAAATTAE